MDDNPGINSFVFTGNLVDHPEWESNRQGVDIRGTVSLRVHFRDGTSETRFVDVIPITFIPHHMDEEDYELARSLVAGDRVIVKGAVHRRFRIGTPTEEYPEGRRESYLELRVSEVAYYRAWYMPDASAYLPESD